MTKATRKEVMEAAASDQRLTERALIALGTIAAAVDAGKPQITQRELGQRHMRSDVWALNACTELEMAGYIRRFRQQGNFPTFFELRLPSSEERARDISSITRPDLRLKRRPPDRTTTARIDALVNKVEILNQTIEALIQIINARLPGGQP